ncbi:saccharopine dehydrogenase (NADP+, L-glutamate forming) [Gillisia mitskevichiae]|uniref:Saccharopine dehydrogenase (NADP+, L-glutamate forming) n=1 Tax=Gillisia mitskevichiae TaxID=270921 RepID=A0A495PKL3_9FLAO|nr:saccharopine dehydrogenase family protein [Gillisia mitskevichiae]RKS50717.1 saccharopine dehydrogenase (NADP+, L-glutamate forming) [Gillisia mitskevichiae]
MRNILVLGAGKSTSVLISYLLEKSVKENIQLTIADLDIEQASKMYGNHENCNVISLDITDKISREKAIEQSDIVISMLPARFNIEVAKDCILLKKSLVSASYVTKEMMALDKEVKENGLVFMNEMGLDPGIDHMSAMQVIDRIRDDGGKLLLFESFCGGLVAPESDTNLWNYKFTWEPRNVVLSGQFGEALFIQEGKYKSIPYNKLFKRTEYIQIDGHGKFEAYANRNSLDYRSIYGLEDILTLYRGTIRRVGFSRAWDMFVQLGMTSDSYELPDTKNMSYREFVNTFLPYSDTDSVEIKMRHNLKIDQDDIMWDKLLDLDLFNDEKIIGIENATPAQALQKILSDTWTLAEDDKDMIVMYHRFGYELNGQKKLIESSMVNIGKDQSQTAMAKTVGLPVAMVTLAILNGNVSTKGVQIPIRKEVYEPILKEMESYGITFEEKESEYIGYNSKGRLAN